LIHIKPSSRPVITHIDHRCTSCGRCVIICPARLWAVKNDHVVLEPAHVNWCTECGSCLQACPASAIDFKYPINGEGVKYYHG
jgi:ferredoxin